MASSDFINAQATFMEANLSAFDENDENKLEYTGIYESYVKIMEDVIDSGLMVSFSQEDIEKFYLDFRDNYKNYESQDKETVDKLFRLTDLENFKDSMLEVKSAVTKDVSASATTQDIDDVSLMKKAQVLQPLF
jgi:hypothetical protein